MEYLADALCAEGLPSVANYYAQALDDDASIDSTDSSICVRHQDVMKAACLAWNNSSKAVKILEIVGGVFKYITILWLLE